MCQKRFTIIVEDGKTIESNSLTLAYHYFAEYCSKTKRKSAILLDNKNNEGCEISV